MSEEKLRAWRWQRQGLDGSLRGASAADVLARTGWARSVAGVGPYLTLFSRAGIGREAADKAVAKVAIHELPSARGCTYVVPAADYALALKVGHGFGHESEMKVARKLGVTDAEIEKLSNRVLKALANGPLLPDEIREAAGGAARSLGPEGKKRGLTTTLPLALGPLQAAGEIRRVPVDGRLDQQRYRYGLWKPNPLAKLRLSLEEAYVELARRYLGWIGAASQAEFQWFSGLGVKAAKAALEPLGLVPLETGGPLLAFPEDRVAYRAYAPPKKPSYTLVSSLDGLFHLRRDLASHLSAEDGKRERVRREGHQAARRAVGSSEPRRRGPRTARGAVGVRRRGRRDRLAELRSRRRGPRRGGRRDRGVRPRSAGRRALVQPRQPEEQDPADRGDPEGGAAVLAWSRLSTWRNP